MGSTSARALEGVSSRRDAPGEEARGRAEQAAGLRKAGGAVAVVSAAVGACVPALLARRPLRRGAREAPGR